jgi:hypothetical protein
LYDRMLIRVSAACPAASGLLFSTFQALTVGLFRDCNGTAHQQSTFTNHP